MVEYQRDGTVAGARGSHKVLRRLSGLMFFGLILIALSLGWQWWAINYSGKLSLAQQISADEFQRGFNFGPVYIEQGRTGRYFVTATLPESTDGTWISRFEVRTASGLPVFGQDEVRLYGEHSFHPGMRDRISRQFSLDSDTGYYFFHFKSENGVFGANQTAPPVVEFSVRQGVISGLALWLPFGCILGLGLLLLGTGTWLRLQFGRQGQGAAEQSAAEPRSRLSPQQGRLPDNAPGSGSALGRRHDRISQGKGHLR